MTDQEIKRIIENGYKTGAVEPPETIMQERIILKITPYALHLLFRKAYRSYCLGKETTMCIYEPLHGEYPPEEQCINGCENCPFNVPDIPKPKNEQDELPY